MTQKMTGGIFCSPVIANVTCHSGNLPVMMTGRTGPAPRPAWNQNILVYKFVLISKICPMFSDLLNDKWESM